MRLFGVPIALVTLLDEETQWFQSCIGLNIDSTPRSISFCTHAIQQPSPMVVLDALHDPRFRDNPLVLGDPKIRFYAGHTFHSMRGVPLGTLCVLDRKPRTFDDSEQAALADLAAMVEQHFHLLEAKLDTDVARTAMQRDQLLFSRVVDQAEVGIAILDKTGRFVDCNRYFGALVGSHDKLPGNSFESVIDPRDHKEVRKLVNHVCSSAEASASLVLRFKHSEQRIAWARVGMSVLPDEPGQDDYVIVVATDIDDLIHAQADLQALQADLEDRIRQRTSELDTTIASLHTEVRQREAAQAALDQEKRHFQRVLEDTSDAFVEINSGDRIVTWNGAAERIFGWTSTEAIGQLFGDLAVPPALRSRHQQWLRRLRASGIAPRMKERFESQAMRRDGTYFPVEITFSVSHQNQDFLVHGFMLDVSQRKADEIALRDSMQRLATITDNLPAMIAHIGADLRYRFHNHAYNSWFDLPQEGLIGKHLQDFWGGALFEQKLSDIKRVLDGESVTIEYSLTGRDGLMWFHGNLVPDRNQMGQRDGFYLLAQDITERKQLYERLEHEATHDPLTGLPNRRALMQRLAEAMARSRRHDLSIGVMFMDLDAFKQMNDTLGHEFGDAVLKRYAANIRTSVRETDFVSRLAGDEFVVVLEDLQPMPEALRAIGESILKTAHADEEVLGVVVRLSSSIGAVIHHRWQEETPQELLSRADAAMYEAKMTGKNCIVVH